MSLILHITSEKLYLMQLCFSKSILFKTFELLKKELLPYLQLLTAKYCNRQLYWLSFNIKERFRQSSANNFLAALAVTLNSSSVYPKEEHKCEIVEATKCFLKLSFELYRLDALSQMHRSQTPSLCSSH